MRNKTHLGEGVTDNFSCSFKQKGRSSDRPTLKLLAKQDTRQNKVGFPRLEFMELKAVCLTKKK